MERGYAQTCSVCSPRDSGWLTNGVAAEDTAVTDSTLRIMVCMWVTMQSLVPCPGTAQVVLRIGGSSLVHAHEMREEQSTRCDVVSQLWWQNASDMVLAGLMTK